jgi:hypothetical protein
MSRFRSFDVRSASVVLAVGVGLYAMAACEEDDTLPSDSTTGSTGGMTTTTGGNGGDGGDGGSGASSGGMGGVGGIGGTGGAPSCLEEHLAGDRYPIGDNCNFCDCNADGTTTCTARTCPSVFPGCEYNGVDHAYAEVFPATDACNECTCAASGLACTRRKCTVVEEGAILVESPDTPCGDDPTFTANAVLTGLPFDDFIATLDYVTTGPYPETLADTTVRVRIVYDGGFAVCRIPNPDQEAFDIEVLVEWMSADGAFDEGFHTYLRRNRTGFTDKWYIAAAAPPFGLDGTYNPACFDANGFTFDAAIDADHTAEGFVFKLCETDLLLDVASLTYP